MTEQELSPYGFKNEELYLNFDIMSVPRLHKKYGYKTPRLLFTRMLRDCLYKILLDIIENNITFVMPIYFNKYCEISMFEYNGELFKYLYNKGGFKDVDFVKSNFCAYRPIMIWKNGIGLYRSRSIYLDKDLTKRISELTNEGKKWS